MSNKHTNYHIRKGKQLKQISTRVTPMTFYNIKKLCSLTNCKGPGRLIDMLVKEKMMSLNTTLNNTNIQK